jgi:hypothetical protein
MVFGFPETKFEWVSQPVSWLNNANAIDSKLVCKSRINLPGVWILRMLEFSELENDFTHYNTLIYT